MIKTGVCDALRGVIEKSAVNLDQLCVALPQYKRSAISGALCTLHRSGWMIRLGKRPNITYMKRTGSEQRIEMPRSPNAVPARYQKSVFVGMLGQRPHLLDPRSNYRERESLAMLTR